MDAYDKEQGSYTPMGPSTADHIPKAQQYKALGDYARKYDRERYGSSTGGYSSNKPLYGHVVNGKLVERNLHADVYGLGSYNVAKANAYMDSGSPKYLAQGATVGGKPISSVVSTGASSIKKSSVNVPSTSVARSTAPVEESSNGFVDSYKQLSQPPQPSKLQQSMRNIMSPIDSFNANLNTYAGLGLNNPNGMTLGMLEGIPMFVNQISAPQEYDLGLWNQ